MRRQLKTQFQWFPGILQLVQATNNYKKTNQIKFLFLVYCWLVPCTFVHKQIEGTILSNHTPRTVASDKV